MWQLDNQTEYAADRAFVRDRDGAEVWLVAVKATLSVAPDGTTTPAPIPASVTLAPEHFGASAHTSLRYDSDLPLTKPGTDVLVHGNAHAPGGHPTPRVDVALRIEGRTKTLAIFGNRTWRAGLLGLSLSEPEPFVTLPVTYERAYGGTDGNVWDRRNPVGVGFATSADHLVDRLAPNIEDPSNLLGSWRQRPRPAGFGPVPQHWSPRAALAGTYDARWEAERAPLLAADLHDDFFYAAPEDQRVPGYLREGSTLELLNLSPSGYLRVVLPKVRPGFRTFFGRESVEHHARLHTVIVEPEVPRVMLVWHTALRCHGREHKLERTAVRMKKVV